MNLSLPLLFQCYTLFPIAYCSFDSNCMHGLLSLLNALNFPVEIAYILQTFANIMNKISLFEPHRIMSNLF